jgi:acetyl esterase/lipase
LLGFSKTVDEGDPMTQLPLPMQQLMARIGPVWGTDIRGHNQLVMGAYAPLLAAANNSGISVTRDVPYGPHPRQVLDIFRPVPSATTAGGAGVVVFVHGGAFVRGDKQASPELYDNLLYWFARQGYLGINIEYRLAPESAYPGGADDVALAMAWLQGHAAEHGGNPGRIFLIGHSAGGTHVASYVFDPALAHHGNYASGAVLISARLRADVSPENPNADAVRAYFGNDAALYDQRSPVSHAASSRLPVFIVTAEFENPLLDVYGLEMAHQLSLARRQAPRYRQMRGHNHMSVVAHFNTGEETLGREILDFFETGC